MKTKIREQRFHVMRIIINTFFQSYVKCVIIQNNHFGLEYD